MSKRNKAPVANADANTTIETAATESAAVIETPGNSDEDILAALEAADPVETEDGGTKVETEVVVEAVEEIDVSLEEQDEDAILAALEADTDTTATPKKKRAAKPKGTVAAAPARAFCDVADHLDDASLKAALDGIKAVKIAEKAQNVVLAITSGKKLSGFTKLAVKTLVNSGRISGKTLVEAYQADGKSLGTARAQAQQMTSLFKVLGIAQPDPANPRELVPANNGLVRELELLAA